MQHKTVSCHISRGLETEEIRQEVLEVMVWPPQILDFNITKSVWDYMQTDLRKPTSTEDLWLVLQDVWNNLSQVPSKTMCKCT